MSKTFYVAWREFSSTVLTKGFLIGALMMPVSIAVVAGAIAITQKLKGPSVVGSIAVIDRTGVVGPGVAARFSKEAMARDKSQVAEKMAEARAQAEKMGIPQSQMQGGPATAMNAAEQSMVDADLTVEILPADADPEKEKLSLATADVHAKPSDTPHQRIALAVIPAGAVRAGEGGGFAEFDLFTAPKLDFEVQERIESKLGDAVVDARLRTDQRFGSSGLSAESVRSLMKRPDAKTVTITDRGEQKNAGAAQMLVPMAFMILLIMSVMTGGQLLLTSTVEEKSSRVMEVLLSAVSPRQLMLGKITGQMCVALLMLTIYSGVGVAGLVAFSLLHIISPMLLVYMFIFFFIAFFTIASLLAAVGSAVSEMREAQTLQTPVIVLIMIPWLMWMPISRAPSSLFSTAMSFTPVINPFVMMIRLTSSEPPPVWQIAVSILVGIGTVLTAVWAAAKIFRIGVLLYGKPPNLRTLVKWVRMA